MLLAKKKSWINQKVSDDGGKERLSEEENLDRNRHISLEEQ